MHERINQVSRETGIPIKKVLDFLFILCTGKPVENNELLQRVGVAKNALNQAKELLSSILKPPLKATQLNGSSSQEVQSLFGPAYKTEEALWVTLENDDYKKSVDLLKKYSDQRPTPERKYDQFTATIETTARRASLLNFFEDVTGKKLLFLGDDDFTSVAVANLQTASEITVLDIDDRILNKIGSASEAEKLAINSGKYDARKSLLPSHSGKFDVVFTDPPYTTEGGQVICFKSRTSSGFFKSSSKDLCLLWK